MRVCATEDKTAAVIVASYRNVSRNPIHFEALLKTSAKLLDLSNIQTSHDYCKNKWLK